MRRRKKGRRTLFQILFRDFAAVFVLMVMILVSLFFAFSFYRSKRDYLEYNQMLLKSIESRLDSYFTGLEEASKPILSSQLLWNAAMGLREEGLEEQLRISFSNLYYYSYHIKSVRLYLPETGRLYSMDRDVLVNNTPFVNSYEEGKVPENIQQAISEPGRYEYQMGQSEDLSVTVGFSHPFKREVAFVYQYTLAESFWEDLIEDLRTEEETVMIFNSSHDLSYCSREELQSYLPVIREKIEERQTSGTFNINLDEQFLLEYSKWEGSDWIVVKAIPLRRLYSNFTTNLSVYGGYTLLELLILAGILASLTRKISNPIGRLTEGLEAVTPDHFELDVYYDKDDEIGALYRKCHENIDMIRNLIKKEYQMNLSEKEARLKILQLQLNPHFIYNVLQLLSNIAVESDNREIEKVTDAFGLLLRYNLANENRKVCVAEEMQALEKYFFIVQKTYGKRLEITAEMEERVKTLEMIPLILQPVVENAFKHGLSRKIGQIRISVKAFLEEGCLKIIVRDNGIGMDQKEVRRINQFGLKDNINEDIIGGKGLALIQSRIELEYGKPYGIRVESMFNIGTAVTVTLPAVDRTNQGKETTDESNTDNI